MPIHDLGRSQFLFDGISKPHCGDERLFLSAKFAVTKRLANVKSMFEIEEDLPKSGFALAVFLLIVNAPDISSFS